MMVRLMMVMLDNDDDNDVGYCVGGDFLLLAAALLS